MKKEKSNGPPVPGRLIPPACKEGVHQWLRISSSTARRGDPIPKRPVRPMGTTITSTSKPPPKICRPCSKPPAASARCRSSSRVRRSPSASAAPEASEFFGWFSRFVCKPETSGTVPAPHPGRDPGCGGWRAAERFRPSTPPIVRLPPPSSRDRPWRKYPGEDR